MIKNYLNKTVLEASKERIRWAIDHFDGNFYVSYSGGKDSCVLGDLVINVAKELGLKTKMVFSDLEMIFQETERHTKTVFDNENVEPFWLCLPEIENNSSSSFTRLFYFWNKRDKEFWVREMPSMPYVIHEDNLPDWLAPYYLNKSVDDWTIKNFGEALCDKENKNQFVNFLGLRSEESYGRMMNFQSEKNRNKLNKFTYFYQHQTPRTAICSPLYDWETADVWKYIHEHQIDYNKVYDQMWKLGISPKEQRTCFFLGNEQKKSMEIIHKFEPKTWERLLLRIEGTNFGKRYNKSNITKGKIIKPKHLSWKEYLRILMASLPKEMHDFYNERFCIIFRYHKTMFEIKENLSPDIYIQDSLSDVKLAMKQHNLPQKKFIAYEHLCGFILRNDIEMKKYGFTDSGKYRKMLLDIYEKQN